MGIKFRCPNGHKLNVKSFLAGKKGICPHCGTRMRIPSDAEQGVAEHDDGDEDSVVESVGGTATAVASAPVRALAENAKVEPVVIKAASAPKAVSAPSIKPVPISTPTITPVKAVASIPAASSPVVKAAATSPIVAKPAAPEPIPAKQPTPTVVDAIAEAPSAEWLVIPPSGGQYGPASGEIMRKWLAEGRVSADSYVWRSGWADWKTAGTVFPQLNPTPVVAETAPIVTGIQASKPNPAVRGLKTKKKSLGFAVAMVVMLGLVSIALVGIFILVIMGGSSA